MNYKNYFTKAGILGLLFGGLISTSSCNAPKRALTQNEFEQQKAMAKMLTTTINNRYVEVGATGNAMTYQTALDIAELNAKAKASRVIAEVLNEVRAQNTNNDLSDEKGGERNLSTSEVYDATVTSKSKSLLTFAEVIETYAGKSEDGSREKMMIVRVRVPLKKDQSVTLLEEAKSDEETN